MGDWIWFVLGLMAGYLCRFRRKMVQVGHDVKMVVVVRSDLKMGRGKVAAQCCHACLAAYTFASKHSPAIVRSWENSGQTKVVVQCASDEELTALKIKARGCGLVAQSIHDAGRTQILAGTQTALAVGPGPRETVDHVTGHLRLL